jgi:hypothetical protein
MLVTAHALDVDERVEDVGDVACFAFLLDADRTGLDRGFDHVGLAHRDRLLARLVGEDIDPAILGARQDARDEARAKCAGRR